MPNTGEAVQVDRLLSSLLEGALDRTPAESGFAIRFDGESEVHVVHSRGFDPGRLEEARAGYSRTILREVRESGMGRVVMDAGSDPRYADVDTVRMERLRSVLVAPVEADDRVVGALWLSNPLRTGAFKFGDLDRLVEFCRRREL